jgi:hypothetical protein
MVIMWNKTNEGAHKLSAFIGEGRNEYLFTKVYYYYTKAQAIKQFKQDIKEKN